MCNMMPHIYIYIYTYTQRYVHIHMYMFNSSRQLRSTKPRWSDRRRDLRRYIRELPDSSKSKAKQKLVGQQVTGTLIDKTRQAG